MLSGIQAEGRLFSQAFSGDVYVGALLRVTNTDTSISESWITLGNAAVYLGLDWFVLGVLSTAAIFPPPRASP